MNTYTVSLKSLFTDMVLTLSSVEASSLKEAQQIALRVVTTPEAWAVNFAVKHGIQE